MSAKGYIGKISAIVTVNTDDAARAFNKSAKDAQNYGAGLKNTIERATRDAGKSFDNIFTSFQKVQRALQASRGANYNLGIDTKSVEQLALAAKQLATPLGAATKQFDALSFSVQRQFSPALTAVQTELLRVRDALQSGETVGRETFTRLSSDVERVTGSISRLGETAALTKRLLTFQDAQGLAFARPEVFDSINRLVEAQRGLASLPAATRGSPAIRELITDAQAAQEQINRITARIERLSSQGLDIRVSQAGLDAAVRRLDDIRERTEAIKAQSEAATRSFTVATESRPQRGLGLFGSESRTESELAIARAKDVSAEFAKLPAAARAGLSGLSAIASRVADGIQSGASNAQQLNAVLDRLSAKIAETANRSPDGFVDVGFLRSSAVAARQVQQAAVEIDVAIESVQRSARQAAQLQAEARFNLAESLPFIDVGTVRARATDAKQVQLAAVEIDVAIESVQRSARQAAQIQAEARFNLADALPFIDEGYLRSSAVAIKQLQDDAVRVEVTLADLRRQAADLRRTAEAAGRDIFPTIPGNPTGPFGPLSANSTQLPPGYAQSRAEMAAGRQLGLAIDDSQRQLEVLRAGIVSVKGQLDQLPAGLRQQFIPAIVAAEAELRRLSAAPNATADQIENARNELDRLSQGAQRAAQSLTLPSFGELVNTSSIRQSTAELEALGRILQRVGAAAGGPAAAAYDRLQQRTQEAIRTGTTGLPAVRRELELLQREAAEAAAQTGRISAGAAFREIQRTGDIARGAFGNVGLAVQQAAFAFEDFFSVTGGLDQRIRAAGNNLSQLGFILGGTTGLFVGIGAAITGQALVALVNWYNGGRTAEDQTKSLNDALARQKSLVEELANAFNSLGDSIARRAFSAPAQQARQFSKELADLSSKQRELREGNLAAFDPDVQRQRAEQSRIQRELGNASSPEEILRLQRELRTAQRRERAITQGLVAGVPQTGEQRGRAIGGLERVFTDVADRTFRTGGVGRPVAIEQARANIRTLQGMGAQEQTDSLRGQQRYIEEDARAGRLNQGAADRAVQAIEAVIARLEAGSRAAIDELATQILKSSFAAALSIESAQEDVADAIRKGVPGAAAFQAALDNTAKQLDEAQQRLRDASQIEDPQAREAAVRQAQDRIRDINNRRDAIDERSRELRLGRTFGGERTTGALSAIQGSERFANEFGGLTARLAVAVDDEIQARRRYNEALASGTDAEQEAARQSLEAAQNAGEVAALMGEAALAMEESLGRLRKIVDDSVSQSEGIANDAQQRLNQDPTDETLRDRNRAEQQLISDRERAARAQNAISARRSEVMSDPRIVAINSELALIDQERKRLAADARNNNTQVDPRQAQRLADREAELLAERERMLLDLTAAEREHADAINQEISARRKLIDQQLREAQLQQEFEKDVANRKNPLGDAMRGADLAMTEAQRADEAIRQGLADISAYFGRLAEATNGLVDRQAEREAQNRFLDNQARAAAPMLVEFANEVANAVAQGPSRAALAASDSSTLEGQRELNRLLRGDDPNKNIDLVELQRQANEYLRIIAQKDGAPVAN